MKKIVTLCIYALTYTQASDISIDRAGYHTGLGGSVVLFDSQPYVLPAFDISLEYGMSRQSTIVLEHHGYLLAGLMALEYKYYMQDDKDSFFWEAGVMGVYAVDYGAGVADGVYKVGLGYAWNHVESDIFAMGDSTGGLMGLSVRYKF